MVYQRVVDARDAVVVLFSDHERSQVGRVAGREDDGKQSPDTRHEPAGHTATTTNRKQRTLSTGLIDEVRR